MVNSFRKGRQLKINEKLAQSILVQRESRSVQMKGQALNSDFEPNLLQQSYLLLGNVSQLSVVANGPVVFCNIINISISNLMQFFPVGN